MLGSIVTHHTKLTESSQKPSVFKSKLLVSPYPEGQPRYVLKVILFSGKVGIPNMKFTQQKPHQWFVVEIYLNKFIM
jgi:hypothetical protein